MWKRRRSEDRRGRRRSRSNLHSPIIAAATSQPDDSRRKADIIRVRDVCDVPLFSQTDVAFICPG